MQVIACTGVMAELLVFTVTVERLKVENITERCRKARLRWFGHVKRRDQEYVGRKTGDGTTWDKKKRKTETEMDGLCQPRHEGHRNDER